jgi:hypothetical protein
MLHLSSGELPPIFVVPQPLHGQKPKKSPIRSVDVRHLVHSGDYYGIEITIIRANRKVKTYLNVSPLNAQRLTSCCRSRQWDGLAVIIPYIYGWAAIFTMRGDNS